MSIDEFEKATMADQSGKKFQQDTDDGLLFFHTHSIWEAICAVEKFYECTIYGVLELQEVVENLAIYDDKYSTVPKLTMLEAISYAYDKVDSSYEYESYLDYIQEYCDTHAKL